MKLKRYDSFADLARDIRKQLNITSKHYCEEKLGIQLATLKSWENSICIPTLTTCLKIIPVLSEASGESPQDILDTILESIPEWRNINKKWREKKPCVR